MLGRILWRHKLFLSCLIASVVALTFLYVSQVPPVFEAETLILLEDRAEVPVALAISSGERAPESVAQAIRSPAMAQRLVDVLSLHLLPEFNPTLQTKAAGLRGWFDPARLVPNSLFNRLPVALREVLSPGAAISDQQHAALLRAEVAERVLAHIVAEPAERASVVRVRFVSDDPRLAELGANTLADLYLADRLAAKQELSVKARMFLLDQIARLRARIAEATLRSLEAQVEPEAPDDAAGAWAEATQADRDRLDSHSARLRRIVLEEQALAPDARVIAVATTPDQPINPRRKVTFGAALFGALLVGSLAALGLERLDNTVSSADQLAQLGLPFLGALPSVPGPQHQRRPSDRDVLDYPDAPFAQAVSALRKELVRASVVSRRTTVLLAAAVAGEGTTTTALCVARAHARAGGRALLIDCDLRKPRLQQLAGMTDQPGLGDVLLGDRTLDQVVQLDQRSGAWLVTAGSSVSEPKELLASDAMRRLTRQAAQDYELVLLDGPPVLGGQGDACVLARIADGTVLLARWGSTPRQDVVAAAGLLVEAGADMVGLVLTRAKGRAGA